jgi:hypothetical protein
MDERLPVVPTRPEEVDQSVEITAAVARPLPSGLEYRRLRRSRLLPVPEHDDHCSRLQIILKISGVLGSSVFTRLCIYCGGVQWHPLNYHLIRASIVPVRGLCTALKLWSLRAGHQKDHQDHQNRPRLASTTERDSDEEMTFH